MFYWTVSISTLYFVHKKSQKSAVIRLLELFCFFALILRFSLRAEVSTGDPHPSTRSACRYSKRFVQTKSEIVRFAHGEIICSANCDI